MVQTFIPPIPTIGEDKDQYHKTTWIFKNSHFVINHIFEINNHEETVTIKMNDMIEIPSITREYVTRFTLAGDLYFITPPTKLQCNFRLFRNGYDVINNDEFNFTKDNYLKNRVFEVLSCVFVVGIPFVLYKDSVIKKSESFIEVVNDRPTTQTCGVYGTTNKPYNEQLQLEQQQQ